MKTTALWRILLFILLISCNKGSDNLVPENDNSKKFIQYTIRQGEHFCDQSIFRKVQYHELKFIVKFDSTAIYQTIASGNQYDINKLFGFSDNNADHHQFSARIGWRWSDGALRLFGYVYNNGEMISRELGTIMIGREVTCSIKINGDKYIFSVNEMAIGMPRLSLTDNGSGYKLYPYFGGDEIAPHTINILIKELEVD